MFGRICPIGNNDVAPSFLLWGDSHAGAIAPAFEQVATANGLSGFVAFEGACAPLLGLKRYDLDNIEQCDRFHDSVLAFIQAKHISNVFLHGRWALYSEGTRYKQEDGLPLLLTGNRKTKENYHEFESLFRSTLEELRRRQINVVIIGSVPEVGMDVPTVLARKAVKGDSIQLELRYSDFMERQARTFGVLSRVAAENAAQVIYPHLSLCDSSSCSVVKEKHALYSDNNHLSVHGSICLVSAVAPFLKEAAIRARVNGENADEKQAAHGEHPNTSGSSRLTNTLSRAIAMIFLVMHSPL